MVPVILLAAGDWRRLQKPVSLLPWGSVTVIEHVLDTLSHTSAWPVVIVLGHEAWSVRKKIEAWAHSRKERGGLHIVVDERHRRGISSWIGCGLRAVPEQADAVIVAFCEQPAVPASVFEGLIEAYRSSGKGIILPVHKGQRGRPVLFGLRKYRERLLGLRQDAGLDEIASQHPEDVMELAVATPAVVTDISAERPAA